MKTKREIIEENLHFNFITGTVCDNVSMIEKAMQIYADQQSNVVRSTIFQRLKMNIKRIEKNDNYFDIEQENYLITIPKKYFPEDFIDHENQSLDQ